MFENALTIALGILLAPCIFYTLVGVVQLFVTIFVMATLIYDAIKESVVEFIKKYDL